MKVPETGRTWRKSRHSQDQGDCVEVALDPEGIGVRDTKNRPGGSLELPARSFAAFTRVIKRSQ